MSSILLAIITFVAYVLAYKFYCGHLSKKIFKLDPKRPTPAHEFQDGVDFVPTKRHILFGHHFTSIAGAGPIVGPAIAVIWGWLPAFLWVIIGSIFMGAVHDLGALVISARNKGRSIGDVTSELIGPRARKLFLFLIFFALLIVIAVFALVIGVLFMSYPETVLPVWIEMPIAIALGFYIYKRTGSTLIASILALAVMYLFVYIGTFVPVKMPPFIMDSVILSWVVVLMVYAYIASILPVWVLLQPRDYINSHQLFVGLGLLYLGLFVARPEIVAPAVNANPEGAPSMLPFIFITIACGAISGFHSLVSSGTTVKQLDTEKDIPFIGYGSMLGEGVLSVMAILACTAGFATLGEWEMHYASWNSAAGLSAKIGAFVEGGATFMGSIGFSHEIAAALVAVLVISFCATTLDTATRLQRYVVAELADTYKLKPLTGRHPATLIAVGTAFALSMINGGKGGMILWPLFGAVNQLLAGLSLLAITMYLVRIRKPVYYAFIPMIFMLVFSSWAMLINLKGFIEAGNWLLIVFGSGIIVLELWLVLEALLALKITRREGAGGVSGYNMEEVD
ncbi:MAG: carbon starvation protein A [Deltaproteobacteria bacterium]|nr:carbon starvation protein A [Deltaproteobacteria bacterium]